MLLPCPLLLLQVPQAVCTAVELHLRQQAAANGNCMSEGGSTGVLCNAWLTGEHYSKQVHATFFVHLCAPGKTTFQCVSGYTPSTNHHPISGPSVHKP